MRLSIVGRAPPSVNGLYQIGRGKPPSCPKCHKKIVNCPACGSRIPLGKHIYLSTEGEAYKEDVARALADVVLDPELRGVSLLVTLQFNFPKLWEGDRPVELDADNRIKITLDAVFGAFRHSDAWIFDLMVRKRVGPIGTHVLIERDPDPAAQPQ